MEVNPDNLLIFIFINPNGIMSEEKQQRYERRKKQHRAVYKKEVPYRVLPHKKKESKKN